MKAFFPINNTSYFTLGLDDSITQKVPCYTLEEYTATYPNILLTMPVLFSLNLKNEIETFVTKAPPHFVTDIKQVIDMACYYYNDWESVVAVTDDYIQTDVLEKVRYAIAADCLGDAVLAQKRLDDIIADLATALVEFITSIIGVLSRARSPGVMDCGSAFRLDNVHESGDVYFQLRSPTQLQAEMEGRGFMVSSAADFLRRNK
jgi:hypothetical protein